MGFRHCDEMLSNGSLYKTNLSEITCRIHTALFTHNPNANKKDIKLLLSQRECWIVAHKKTTFITS